MIMNLDSVGEVHKCEGIPFCLWFFDMLISRIWNPAKSILANTSAIFYIDIVANSAILDSDIFSYCNKFAN